MNTGTCTVMWVEKELPALPCSAPAPLPTSLSPAPPHRGQFSCFLQPLGPRASSNTPVAPSRSPCLRAGRACRSGGAGP